MIRKKVEISFSELTADAKEKIDIIVSFLAILEMVKQKVIDVEQNESFREIKLKHNT
jgi:segregation and condensation protein A